MNHKSITPNPQQPVDRVPAGQLPSALAQLSEETLGGTVAPSMCVPCLPSYDGDTVTPSSLFSFGSLPPCVMCSYDGDDE